MPAPSGIFVSYSHKDKQWLDRVQTALKPLVFNEMITLWDDRSIAPGANWRKEIDTAMAEARIAVLLVTQEFLASSFIHRAELPEMLKRRAEQGMGFFWVPIEDTLYKFTPLKDIQSAWDPARPLVTLNQGELASALVTIATRLAEWQPIPGPAD